jgi:hypothetical protein
MAAKNAGLRVGLKPAPARFPQLFFLPPNVGFFCLNNRNLSLRHAANQLLMLLAAQLDCSPEQFSN